MVIAGHGRLEATKQLGLLEVPVIAITDMSEAQRRAYLIADNKLAENAGWDRELLTLELGALEIEAPELSLDVIGFETAELDLLLNPSPTGDEPEMIDLPVGSPVTQAGDLWRLGKHRLLCGDALQAQSYTKVLSDRRAAATTLQYADRWQCLWPWQNQARRIRHGIRRDER